MTAAVSKRDAPQNAGLYTLVCVWLVSVAGIAVLDPEDWLAISLAAIVPTIPLLVYCLVQGSKWLFRLPHSVLLGGLAIVAVSVNFRHRGYDDKSIDLQAGLRLFGIAMLMLLGLPAVNRAISHGARLAPLLWLAFFTFNVASCAYAQNPVVAFGGAVSLLAGYLFAWNYADVLGTVRFTKIVVGTFVLLAVVSLVAYFIAPDLARLKDWQNDVLVSTTRLQGVLSAPNAVGMSASFCALIVLLFLQDHLSGRLLWMTLALCALCVILSNNRMAIVAFAASGLFIFLRGPHLRTRLAMVCAGAVVLTVAYIALGDRTLTLLSRSGSADEILTITGRLDIWAASASLISEAPLLGLGYNSSLEILPKRPELFSAAAHTHNMFLETFFSGGLIGGTLFVAALAATAQSAVAHRSPQLLAIAIFFVVYGMTEPVVYGFVNFPALAFLAGAVLMFTPARRPHRAGLV